MHSEKPKDKGKGMSEKMNASLSIDEENAEMIAKELGLNIKGDSCPYEGKGTIDDYIVGKEIGIHVIR